MRVFAVAVVAAVLALGACQDPTEPVTPVAHAVRPQFETAGKWCPIMSPDGQVWWVWYENSNASCPPFHPPGSGRAAHESPFSLKL